MRHLATREIVAKEAFLVALDHKGVHPVIM